MLWNQHDLRNYYEVLVLNFYFNLFTLLTKNKNAIIINYLTVGRKNRII